MFYQRMIGLIALMLLGVVRMGVVSAQNCSLDALHPIVLKGNTLVYQDHAISLNERTVFVNGNLSGEQDKNPYVFATFQSAVDYVQQLTGNEPVYVYLAPFVYWVDNPEVPEVVIGKDGREPFGMTIRYKNLHFIGLNPNPETVVLASQRGQTQGAIGNFTMFDFHGDSIWVSNLTMGNYCNVDLNYPLQPSMSRQKRSEAITQAHVGYVKGSYMVARNVRFISRLNLNPLNGADRSEYDSCHFECTDDALNGTAIYRHCRIDLYGQKPFWSTFGAGAAFIDCHFYAKGDNTEMYFCKQGGPLTLIRCHYHAPSVKYLGWTAYPQPWLRCYQQEFWLNNRPYIIGDRQLVNTVVVPDKREVKGPLFLPISQREATLVTGEAPLTLQAGTDGEHIRWEVPAEYADYVQLSATEGHSISVSATNKTDEMAVFCISARTVDGLEAACLLSVKPSVLPPPSMMKRPKIRLKKGCAWLDYQLDLAGAKDQSSIIWYADGIPVGVGNGFPLNTGYAGHILSARLQPRSSRSNAGEWVGTDGKKFRFRVSHLTERGRLDTDFSHFYCDWQPEIRPGFWTVDGFKPADTAEFPWTFNRQKPMWEYGKGFNGAVGEGLLQAQRGARLMYTPAEGFYSDMSLTLHVDPTKTAGQGFGSATGQYMDVCLKFDPHTLTGYGLRIIRTVKYAKAVDFYLVAYENGHVKAISEAISATCYRTGCTISLQLIGNRLSAHVETTTPKPADSALPHVVDLSAEVKGNAFGGVAIQHTGSCGESTTMLHRLQVQW